MADPVTILRFLVVIFISITIHEFSHALAADWLGDDMPRYQGRLTLSPLAHLDPLGTIMIIISSLSGFGFGWGRPVQVNPTKLKYGPAVGMGIVAIAGPTSNIILAMLFALIFHGANAFDILNEGLLLACLTFVIVNVSLAFFNMIPIFPLDGFRVALAILRLIRGRTALQIAYRLEDIAAFGPQLFLFLILFDRFLPFSILNLLVGTPTRWVIRLLGF